MKSAIIAFDISSETLDAALKNQTTDYVQIKNEVPAIARFLKKYDHPDTIVAMENTGRYNWNLYEVLASMQCRVYVINPLHLKKSLGLIRGKNDKIDAMRICSYIEKNYMDERQWKPSTASIKALKVLLCERQSRVKEKKRIQSQIHSLKGLNKLDMGVDLLSMRQQRIKAINEEVKTLDQAIKDLIKSNEKLKTQDKLIQSVPGAGEITSWTILAKTEGFTKITEPRKMACYAGVVPFEYQSGTSIRGKTKVSVYADKGLKALLHLGAMSAIRLENDLAVYYRRKVKEGKNKMSVLNAVRNKMIHRIFAVIRTEQKYQNCLLVS